MRFWSWTAGLLVAVAVSSTAWAQPPQAPPAEGRSVSCSSARGESDEALERRALKTALRGAWRMSPHELTVSTRSGVSRFVDRKPYRHELSGFHWLYCGYLPSLQAHLVGVFDEDLFTGKLLLDKSGQAIEAGRAVFPAPGGKLFLAASQKNGKALEDWVLSDLAGRRLWSGPSGFSQNDAILVEYANPHWTSDGAIRVSARCADGSAKGAATLVREGRGWSWKSDLRCEPGRPAPSPKSSDGATSAGLPAIPY
jgi:hypothetical protein